MKYTEIFKLKDLLERAKIPFDFIEHTSPIKKGFQICYPERGGNCVCSVIEHSFSYGNESDLLEIQGLMTKKEEEKQHDSVLGFLTAENVFKRIKKHYKENR